MTKPRQKKKKHKRKRNYKNKQTRQKKWKQNYTKHKSENMRYATTCKRKSLFMSKNSHLTLCKNIADRCDVSIGFKYSSNVFRVIFFE